MPNAINLPPPKRLTGQAEEQLSQVYAYLYNLCERMNMALTQVGNGESVGGAQTKGAASGAAAQGGGQGSGIDQKEINQLQALIVKTASSVRSEMQTKINNLQGIYVAQGDFGTYMRENYTEIEENARETIQNYSQYDVTMSENFLNARETSGYIKHGFIYEEEGVPVIGIAISQETIQTTEEEIEGETFTKIEIGEQCILFLTPHRVEFYDNGTRRGYITPSEAQFENLDVATVKGIDGILNLISEKTEVRESLCSILVDDLIVKAGNIRMQGETMDFTGANLTFSGDQLALMGEQIDLSANEYLDVNVTGIRSRVDTLESGMADMGKSFRFDENGISIYSAKEVDGEIMPDENAPSLHLDSGRVTMLDPTYSAGEQTTEDDKLRWIVKPDVFVSGDLVNYTARGCLHLHVRQTGEKF